MASKLTEEQNAELEALTRKAETGDQFAEVCRREALMLDHNVRTLDFIFERVLGVPAKSGGRV